MRLIVVSHPNTILFARFLLICHNLQQNKKASFDYFIKIKYIQSVLSNNVHKMLTVLAYPLMEINNKNIWKNNMKFKQHSEIMECQYILLHIYI